MPDDYPLSGQQRYQIEKRYPDGRLDFTEPSAPDLAMINPRVTKGWRREDIRRWAVAHGKGWELSDREIVDWFESQGFYIRARCW